jgi:deoxyribodipyrimidine photo-lyase
MKVLVWFRNDLRTIDHEPLYKASILGEVVPVYCFDPRHFNQTVSGFPKTGAKRAKFLIECVSELRKQLNGSLIVRIGKPEIVIPELVRQLKPDAIYYHAEVTDEELRVESAVRQFVHIPMQPFFGHTMYHPDDLPFAIHELPNIFTTFRNRVEKYCIVRKPLNKVQLTNPVSEILAGKIPEVSDLGLKPKETDNRTALYFKGGENEATRRLNHYYFTTDSLRNYKFTRNGLMGADYSSKFSPWMAQGCISARTIYNQTERYEREIHKNESTYWMKFELTWRDYFRFSAMKHGNDMFRPGGIQRKKLNKKTDEKIFWKWADGQTGIPFIDANMRELKQTGYMSNRGRQNVASFLAQNLNFDWRQGAAWFESQLIDYDVCSNWGNWAYNATVGHDPRNRYFNILHQAEKYDPKGDYVRLWIPELKQVPAEFIHQPHKMSVDQQLLSGVEIGKEYPEPMIDLELSYRQIMDRD